MSWESKGREGGKADGWVVGRRRESKSERVMACWSHTDFVLPRRLWSDLRCVVLSEQ